MCTRFTIASNVKAIESEFQAEFQYEHEKNYNASFGAELPVILAGEETKVQRMRWGLVPFWSKEPNLKFHHINAEARNIVKHAAYRVPIRRRRCLVPSNCFFIWVRQQQGGKAPYIVYDGKHRLISFAGIWDTWTSKDRSTIIHSFAIITAPAVKRIRPFSASMPVIITPERRRKYLRLETPLMDIVRMLRNKESDSLNLYPVSMEVNNFYENSRDAVLPVGQRVYKEVEYVPKVYLKLEGMGSKKDNPDRKPEIKMMI